MSTNFLSEDEIADIVNNPIVKTNKENLTGNSINFSIPLTDTLKVKLEQLGLDLSQLTSIPMRWMTGDTAPHKDKGPSQFKNTYLIYLTDSVGNLIVDDQSYPIAAGDAHMFREGLEHYTINTGGERLMIGPMSESGVRVGVPTITVYFFTDDTFNQTGTPPTGFSYSNPYGQNYIKIFDLPPPTPVSDQYGTIDDTTFAPADWTPPPGKTFGGWKYWSGTDFQMVLTQPLDGNPSTIYQPGAEYEYINNCVLIPNWVDKVLIYFLTDDKFLTEESSPAGFAYNTPPYSSIYGTITIFGFPPTPVTQEGLYDITYEYTSTPDWSPPPGKTFGGWKYWSLPPGGEINIYPINSDLSHIYRPGETYEYSAACVLIVNWIDLPRPPRFSLHFTNNSMVYYKSHSLSTGGGGSGVRNSRHKRRKT